MCIDMKIFTYETFASSYLKSLLVGWMDAAAEYLIFHLLDIIYREERERGEREREIANKRVSERETGKYNPH